MTSIPGLPPRASVLDAAEGPGAIGRSLHLSTVVRHGALGATHPGQAADLGQERPPIYFYAFDLLHLNGKDLRSEPVVKRKVGLEKLLKKPPGIMKTV